MSAAAPLLCPSARCTEGARLIGIVRKDGTVAFTPDDLRIDAAFVEAARAGRRPESRFRFANLCQGGRCVQWTGERCGVADAVVHAVEESGIATAEQLPNCAIRSSCRWFDQCGAAACQSCPLVVTDLED